MFSKYKFVQLQLSELRTGPGMVLDYGKNKKEQHFNNYFEML